MYILIPVDSDNGLASKITTQADMKTWALVTFEDGKAETVQFSEDRTAFGIDWIDFVVLEN
jgi:predicted Fe-Mo cluster-binding NifX family protein